VSLKSLSPTDARSISSYTFLGLPIHTFECLFSFPCPSVTGSVSSNVVRGGDLARHRHSSFFPLPFTSTSLSYHNCARFGAGNIFFSQVCGGTGSAAEELNPTIRPESDKPVTSTGTWIDSMRAEVVTKTVITKSGIADVPFAHAPVSSRSVPYSRLPFSFFFTVTCNVIGPIALLTPHFFWSPHLLRTALCPMNVGVKLRG
jgi:hypothetical protein